MNFVELRRALKKYFVTRDGNNTIGGHIFVDTHNAYDLGSSTHKFRTIYADSIVGTPAGTDELVKVTAGDSAADYLDNKIAVGSWLSKSVSGTPAVLTLSADLTPHTSDANAHHDAATAGDGISLTGQVISVNSTVVRTTRTISTSDPLSGGGDLSANRTLTLTLQSPSGLSVSTGLAIADTIAGNGLSISSKVLSVNVGDGLEIASDAVAIDLATNSGLTFSSGDLAMGTPTTITTAIVANSVTADTHVHLIDHTNNTDADNGSKFLSSDGSGKLTLRTLEVKNDDFTATNWNATLSQQLTIFKVNAVDFNVGIMREPDPQFALDISGAMRADYIVGKMAIQLSDALLIAHYDGAGPYNTNTVGEFNGHKGQEGIASGNVLIRWGLFQGALDISSAYTNILSNPQFDSGSIAGYTAYSTGSATGSRVVTQEDAWAGEYSYKLIKTGGTGAWGTQRTFSTSGTNIYCASVWMKVLDADSSGDAKCTMVVILDGAGFAGTTTSTYVFSADPGPGEYPFNEWVRLAVKASANGTNGSGTFTVRNSIATAFTALVDAFQVTQTPVHMPYYNGSRTEGTLRYEDIEVNWRRMTWMAWVRLEDTGTACQIGEIRVDDSNRYNFAISNTGRVNFLVNGSAVASGAIPVTAREWFHVAVTVNGLNVQTYVNGVADATGTITTLPEGIPDVRVGSRNASGQRLDGQIDEFVITSRVEPAARIRSIYESNAPVFAESSVFSFRATPQGLVWADSNGLWVKNTLGDAVFGVYGNAATKAWGGVTLNPSDLLIGDANRGAYVHWDDSAGEIIIGRTGSTNSNMVLNGTTLLIRSGTATRVSLGAGVLDLFDSDGVSRIKLDSSGNLTIRDGGGNAVFTFDTSTGAQFTRFLTLASTGGIYQGSGSPTAGAEGTGLKIWRDGNIGRIAGYNGNTLQWGADTSGRFTAGGGNVILDANGLSLVSGSGVTNSILWTVSGSERGRLYFTHGGEGALTMYSSGISPNNIIDLRVANGGNPDILMRMDQASGITFYPGISTALPPVMQISSGVVNVRPELKLGGNLRVGTGTNTTQDSTVLAAGDGSSTTNGIIFKPNSNAQTRTAAIFMDQSTGFGLRIVGQNAIHIDGTNNAIGLYLQTIYGGRVGIGAGAGFGIPQSTLYIHDNVGGWMHWSGSGINTTATVFHANQTGDVGKIATFLYTVWHSGGGTAGGTVSLVPNGTSNVYSAGGNTLELKVNTNGSVQVRASALASGTFSISLSMVWLA